MHVFFFLAVNQFVIDTVDLMLGDLNLLVVQCGIVNFTHGRTGLKENKNTCVTNVDIKCKSHGWVHSCMFYIRPGN